MWPPEQIVALVSAVTALVTAAGGIIALLVHQRTGHPGKPGGQ